MEPPRPQTQQKPVDGLFLERKIYRRRRLIDGARLFPILAGLMFLLPALFVVGNKAQTASTAIGLVYFFFVWLVMIMIAATFARALDRSEKDVTGARQRRTAETVPTDNS